MLNTDTNTETKNIDYQWKRVSDMMSNKELSEDNIIEESTRGRRRKNECKAFEAMRDWEIRC